MTPVLTISEMEIGVSDVDMTNSKMLIGTPLKPRRTYKECSVAIDGDDPDGAMKGRCDGGGGGGGGSGILARCWGSCCVCSIACDGAAVSCCCCFCLSITVQAMHDAS